MKYITPAICTLAMVYNTFQSNACSQQVPETLIQSSHIKTPPVSLLANHPRSAERYLIALASNKKRDNISKPSPELSNDASQGILCFALRDTHDIAKIKKYTKKLAESTDPFPLLAQLPLCAQEPHECNIAQCIKILFSYTYFSNDKHQQTLYSSLVLRALKEEAHCSLRQLRNFRHLISLTLVHQIAQQINQQYKLDHFINALPFSKTGLANCLHKEFLDKPLCDIGRDACSIIAAFVGNNYFFSLLSNTRLHELKHHLLSDHYIDFGRKIGLLTDKDIEQSKLL